MEESIYSLIQPEPTLKFKPAMFRSQFPGVIAPTGSTFNNKTTNNQGINNVSGSIVLAHSPHSYKNESATFGRPSKKSRYASQQLKPLLKNSCLVNSLESWGNPRTLSAELRRQNKLKLKPLVPLHLQPKNLNLSEKNFVLTNAVETMILKPKISESKINYLKKSDYGKVPDYLSQVKQSIQSEYDLAQSIYVDNLDQQDQKKYLLPQAEIEELKLGLKAKFDEVNLKYQLTTHMSEFDTIGLRRRKQMYEKELIQIETDLEKLNKHYVFVDTTL